MRAVVMAALHFDFEQALTHGNTSDRARNALLFNEESTNMENFNNLLVQFRKLSAEQIQAMRNREGMSSIPQGREAQGKVELAAKGVSKEGAGMA